MLRGGSKVYVGHRAAPEPRPFTHPEGDSLHPRLARAVIWFLLGNEYWIGWHGYVGLLCSLEEYPKNTDVLDECQDICEQMWADLSRRVVDGEWQKLDRIAIITEFASKL
jgi:hypothetical protein